MRRGYGRLRAGGNGSLYLGLNGTFNYVVDVANGNDANPGTPASPFKTLKKITGLLLSAGVTTRVLVKAGTYSTLDDYVLIQSSPLNSRLEMSFEPGCVMDGTAANVAVPGQNGFELGSTNLHYTYVYGNGLQVNNYSEATAASPNGYGCRGLNVSSVYDVRITNCDDGFSAHETAILNLYDCTASGGEKSAFSHIDSSVINNYRCTFTGGLTGTQGIGSISNDTVTAYFEDCVFIPTVAGQSLGLRNSTLVRCQVGTLALRVDLANISPTLPTNASYCFLNLFLDGDGGLVADKCFGMLSLRYRTGGTQNVQRCVFTAPASGKAGIFMAESVLGVQTLTANNNIFKTATAVAFMNSVDTTYAGQIVAANQQYWNNALNSSAAYDADLIAADSGNTVIKATVTANTNIGAGNTLLMADYAYGAGSPAIGAGTSGTNIGFGASDVQVRRTRIPALP